MYVIVEDSLSAIRLSVIPHVFPVCLLGTHMTVKQIRELKRQCKEQPIVIWLDDDAHTKAVKLQSRLGIYGIKAYVVRQAEPKEMTDREIEQCLRATVDC